MILKFEEEDPLYFLEATGGEGVALTSWAQLKGYRQ